MKFEALHPAEIKAPSWIVKKLFEAGTVIMFYGDSYSGKTYIVLSLAYSIITGLPFAGFDVKKKGPVAYLCGEGRSGIARRLHALEIDRGMSVGEDFRISDGPTALSLAEQARELESALEHDAEVNNPPVMLIIDTWARNLGGDENSSQDVATALQCIDAIRARFPEMCVVIIHHTGQADKTRARGSYSLKCAVDVEAIVEKGSDELARFCITKQKDGEAPPPLAFRFRSVSLGFTDEDFEPVFASCVQPTTFIPAPKSGSAGTGKNQLLAKRAFEELWRGRTTEKPGVTVKEWREACKSLGIPSNKVKQTIDPILEDSGNGYVLKGEYLIWEPPF